MKYNDLGEDVQQMSTCGVFDRAHPGNGAARAAAIGWWLVAGGPLDGRLGGLNAGDHFRLGEAVLTFFGGFATHATKGWTAGFVHGPSTFVEPAFPHFIAISHLHAVEAVFL